MIKKYKAKNLQNQPVALPSGIVISRPKSVKGVKEPFLADSTYVFTNQSQLEWYRDICRGVTSLRLPLRGKLICYNNKDPEKVRGSPTLSKIGIICLSSLKNHIDFIYLSFFSILVCCQIIYLNEQLIY